MFYEIVTITTMKNPHHSVIMINDDMARFDKDVLK